ncbi:translation initiation factor eIF4e, partial [Polychaeton citri CBS 116435]
TSPARGAEMRNFLQSRLLQKNRAPPLVHSWEFWHDRQDRAQQQEVESKPDEQQDPNKAHYESRLVSLAPVNDVRSFWNVFNNFDVTHLPLRDSVHLFHKGVKPIWEDTRNSKGGSWTFRIPKSAGPDVWKEICMLAIGEKLQEAVESDRTTFRDDICGITLGVRFNSYLLQIWNRDGAHEEGIQRVLNVVMSNLSDDLAPREGSYYYKRHDEHAGF